jgi:hypothetical protein
MVMLKPCLLFVLFLSFGFSVDKNTFSEGSAPKPTAIPAPFLPITFEEVSGDTLVPITIVEPKSKKVFEKYGLEFQGNCYECDLVNLKISKQKLVVTNVCDVTKSIALKVLLIKNSNNQLTISTPNSQWTIAKMAKEGVYQLKIEGNRISKKGFRMSTFFTPKKKLRQFEIHDCGDFQG